VAASTIISALTLGTVVVGGLWAYYRLYKRREHAVRLDFTTIVNFVGVQDGKWLISLDAHVNNEGLVRHEITRFDMELRCLLKTDRITTSPELGGQVVVPHELLKGSWLPKNWGITFIEPGLKTVYSFVFSIPVEASFVLLHGYLDYRDGGHSAEVLAAVPPAGSPANSHTRIGSSDTPQR
jgi:hypothetical protein